MKDAQSAQVNITRITECNILTPRVLPIRPRQHPKQRHQVAGSSCEWPRSQVTQGLVLSNGKLPGVGNEPTTWLVPEDPVEERRHADGATYVSSQPKR